MSASTLPILLRSLGLTTLARDYPEASRPTADKRFVRRFSLVRWKPRTTSA